MAEGIKKVQARLPEANGDEYQNDTDEDTCEDEAPILHSLGLLGLVCKI